MDQNSIVNDIINYITQTSYTTASDWYVGIATSPSARLFSDHNVDQGSGHWIYCQAMSEKVARAAEQILIRKHPFKGGVGGGLCPTYVYAYRITSFTSE